LEVLCEQEKNIIARPATKIKVINFFIFLSFTFF
jgi:hypothetical protein